jgi:hypothetical protein
MSDIVGKDAARAALDALIPRLQASLQAARTASPLDRMKAMEAAKAQLSGFFNSTRPANLGDPAEVKAVRDIDQIAFDMLTQLTVDQVDLGVGALSDGAARLRSLTTALDRQTATVSSAAKSVSLQPVKKAVDSMTAMVQSIKDLKKGLKADKPDEAAVAKTIDDLVAKFEALRSAVSATG